jgi:hypothetical protein
LVAQGCLPKIYDAEEMTLAGLKAAHRDLVSDA